MQRNSSRLLSIVVVLAMTLAFTASYSGAVVAAPLQAISLTGGAYTQNFDTLATSGTTNVLSITDWYLTESGGGSRDNEQYAADNGSSTTGDTYSYGPTADSDRALGGLQSSTLNPVFGAEFINNTGGTITSLDVSYTGEEWRYGGTISRTDQIDFQLSTDATSLTTGAWTDYNSLDFVTPNTATPAGARDGNNATNRTAISYTITGLSIANGASFWIRWTDTNPSGSDDGLAVDDFSITPNAAATPNLSINNVTQAEGNSGTSTFTFTVSLDTPAGVGGVTFDIATADDSATDADNDYEINSLASQTIMSGNSTYTFDVTVNGDTNIESNESFFVNVTNVSGANISDGQGVGTITNDDSPPDLSIDNVTQVEGNSGTSTFTFTVSLSSPAPVGGVTFDIATADGSAHNIEDYGEDSLYDQTIPFGNSSYTFDIYVFGDFEVEGDETFYVNVTNVSGANISDGQGVGTITNDDSPPDLIHDIQGSGSASPLIGNTVAIRAIVVGDFQTQGSGQLRGFFLQEENDDVDARFLLSAQSANIST